MKSRFAQWWVSMSLSRQILVAVAAAFCLWLLWAIVFIRGIYWLLARSFPGNAEKSIEVLGQIGDLFGGINALFAAFAFVGVAFAAYYQHKTFKLQAEQSVRQSFEPLFFKLLDAHKPPEVLIPKFDMHETSASDETVDTSTCMDRLRDRLNFHYDFIRRSTPDSSLDWSWSESIYDSFYQANDRILAPYFRKLYHLFKFIATSDLSWGEKVRYANIARASLDKNELLLLALNCGSDSGEGAKFRPLVEIFSILKHVNNIGSVPTMEYFLAKGLFGPTATMSGEERDEYWNENPEEFSRCAIVLESHQEDGR